MDILILLKMEKKNNTHSISIESEFDLIQLCEDYNKKTELTNNPNYNFDIINPTYCMVYLPIKDKNLLNYCLIDTIGQTSKNQNQFQKQMDFINFLFTNKLTILVTKNLKNNYTNSQMILHTFSDDIDYSNKKYKTEKEKHKEFYQNNKCLFVDNKSDIKEIKNDDLTIEVHNTSNFGTLGGKLLEQINKQIPYQIRNINDFIDILNQNKDKSKEELLEIVYSFNNKKIFVDFLELGYNLNSMNKKVSDLRNKINNAKEIWKGSKNNNFGTKALSYIYEFVKNELGDEYTKTHPNSIEKEFINNEIRKWEMTNMRIFLNYQRLSSMRRERE